MVEIVIASGKGGTGKTTVSSFIFSYFAKIRNFRVIGIDADVEAPDMLIAVGSYSILERKPIKDSLVAKVTYDKCISCGKCLEVCNFGAIDWFSKPMIVEHLCEGCGACSIVCPTNAISFKKVKTGDIILAETPYGYIVTGELEIGKRHSGHLVEILKNEAKKFEHDYLIVDSAAGTGCSVISSIVGADYLIIVVEPTPQSLRTAKKIFEIGKHFNVRMGVIINKFDVNEEFVDNILAWTKNEKLDFLGTIPYDYNVIRAYTNMTNLLESYPNSPATKSLISISEKILSIMRDSL